MSTSQALEDAKKFGEQFLKGGQERMAEQQKAITEKYTQKINAVTEDQKKKVESGKKDAEEAGKSDVDFTGHLETRKQTIKIDLPEITMRDEDIFVDVPVLKMTRHDITATVPVFVMQRVEGPEYPSYTLEWGKDDFGLPSPTLRTEMKKSYYDFPKTEWRDQGYSFDAPEVVGTERQRFVVRLPDITMKTTEMSYEYPVFIIEKIKIGREPGKIEGAKTAIEEAVASADREREKLTAEMSKEMSWATMELAPGMLLNSQALATAGFVDVVKPVQEQLTPLYRQQKAFVDEGIPLGDPRRSDIDRQIVILKFQLQMMEGAANQAVFQAWQKTIGAIVENAKGLSKDEVEASLKEHGFDKPGPVIFDVGIR